VAAKTDIFTTLGQLPSIKNRYHVYTSWTLAFDLDFQFLASYGHDPHRHKSSSSNVSRFKR